MTHIGEKFECYSPRLRGWFMTKGIRYEYKFIHKDTGRTAYVYTMDVRLAIALTQWKANNPNKRDGNYGKAA